VTSVVRSGSPLSVALTARASAVGAFSSREDARRPPQLVVETEDSPPPADPVIAAAGDIACDPGSSSFNGGAGTADACRQMATSDLLVGRGLAAVLPLGDIQYEDGPLSKFGQSYDPSWGRVKSITRPAVGNHEYGVSEAAGYFDYFGAAAGERGKGWYSYDVGAWHLVALNSNCDEVGGCDEGSPQEQWLRQDLAAHPACTLAYWHRRASARAPTATTPPSSRSSERSPRRAPKSSSPGTTTATSCSRPRAPRASPTRRAVSASSWWARARAMTSSARRSPTARSAARAPSGCSSSPWRRRATAGASAPRPAKPSTTMGPACH
jgi:hypothetical protein